MAIYYTETVMKNGSKECILVEAGGWKSAMNEVSEGHKEDGKEPAYIPVKRKVSKKEALRLIEEEGVRCWATI